MLKEIKVNNQSIESITISCYGDLSYMSKLLADNGLNWDSSIEGLTLIYDDVIIQNIPSAVQVVSITTKSDIVTIKTKDRQSFYDFALQYQSSFENIIELARMNELELYKLDLVANKELMYNTKTVQDKLFFNFAKDMSTAIESSYSMNGSFNDSFNSSLFNIKQGLKGSFNKSFNKSFKYV